METMLGGRWQLRQTQLSAFHQGNQWPGGGFQFQVCHVLIPWQYHLSPPHLGGPAGGIGAHGAGHQHLRVHRLSLLQVIGHQVRQALNEDGVGVWGRASCDPLSTDFSAQLFSILNVQFVQGLNVVVHKGNRYQHEILLTTLYKGLQRKNVPLLNSFFTDRISLVGMIRMHLYGILSARFEPRQWTHFTLEI